MGQGGCGGGHQAGVTRARPLKQKTSVNEPTKILFVLGTLSDRHPRLDFRFGFYQMNCVGFDCSRPAYPRHDAQALLFARSRAEGFGDVLIPQVFIRKRHWRIQCPPSLCLAFPRGSFVMLAGLSLAAFYVRYRFHKGKIISGIQIERKVSSHTDQALPGFWQPASALSA
jgi:hypothetical protein